MDNITNNNFFISTNRFSANEIAEMVNSHSNLLFDVDLGFCTDWYRNVDYMEDIISKVNSTEDIDLFINLLLLKQDQQTNTENHPKVCYRVTDERKFAPYVNDLATKLDAIRTRVLHNREIQKQLNDMKQTWCSTQTTPTDFRRSDNTEPPAFANPTEEAFHMEDLPKDVRKHFLLKDNKLYSMFVSAIKGPIKDWISKHRLQDWNVVRFICMLRGIVTRKCPMEAFGLFLEYIGLGNQLNNMKKRSDANSANAILVYDDPNKKNSIWKLKLDGDEVEKILNEVIESNVA